ncbi:MAG: TIGR04283 family arsenosugar biosynthesis glycosyltransferase [Marinobacter sp.]|nr:TIGR04283 family arsenosugar biosynthesis glycosyltransferase [Marinobacter sp.]
MPPDGMALTIIVPVLNEFETLPALLEHLKHWQSRGAEVLIVDGGSNDQTAEEVRHQGFAVIDAPRGRASQMNAGAQASRSRNLVFLHADTRLPEQADLQILAALRDSDVAWGRFDVRIEGESKWLPIIAWFMNTRSRLTGIATGDQALFMTRNAFDRIEGFPEQPLMEDIEISRRLKQMARPVCLGNKVITSGRRWDSRGSGRTIWLMWQLRWAYWRGIPAEQLAERYR